MKKNIKSITFLLIIVLVLNIINFSYVHAIEEIKTLDELPAGAIVYDAKSIWEYKDYNNYGGNVIETAPVEWKIVKQNHFANKTTLLISNKIVALHEYNPFSNCIAEWGTSSLRKWLRNTFRNHLSSDFKNNIVTVTTFTADKAFDDNIFVLSLVELDQSASSYLEGNHGTKTDFFNYDKAKLCALGYREGKQGYLWYWTRSPRCTTNPPPRYAHAISHDGDPTYEDVISSSIGVRPALNLKSEILVKSVGNNKWEIIWNQSPALAVTKPTPNSPLLAL